MGAVLADGVPQQVDAIVITAPGGPQVLQWRSGVRLAPLGDDEVLIEVAYAGVNRHDCNQRRRGPTPAHSDVPGLEVSGCVRALGARVRGLALGERVCALVDGGGYATHAVAPAALCFATGPALDLQTAAALPEALFTVWHNFMGVAALAAGETVLLHGGTSGVGSVATPLLRALGHPVLVTCGSDAKVVAALQRGATAAINYRTQDFVAEVLRATQGRGVDVILDMVGAAYAVRNVEALARRGRLVHLAPGDGADFSAPLRAIMAKEAKVTGSLLRPLPLVDKTLIAERLRAVVWPVVVSGQVRPWVTECFAMQDAATAHARLESGEAMGKILLQNKAFEPSP
jgi:NADPH2:quinone reductase